MLFRTSLLAIGLFTAALPITATAQDQPPALANAASLAEGWALLARRDAAGAALIAGQVLARDPHNPAAVALAVDAEFVREGPSAALAAYERWLANRKVDDAYILRRIARAMLVEATGKQPNARARLEALQALAADGDLEAAANLERAALENGVGEARALAALGNERAVNLLIGQLAAFPGGKTPIIDALGDSGSKLAVPPLRTLLSDPNDLNRAAAAGALGRLGATEAIPQLRPLLNDPVFAVKLKAAGALFRLHDSTGLSVLTTTAGSEHAAIRMAAARELAAQPDALWQSLVRTLADDPDPSVRLDAAKLLAPYDQPLAKSVLDALMRDANIGIREAASGVLVEQVATDFATLRTLLRSGDVATRVKAAGRILELTR
jgi:HEAT repeat protein